MSEQEINAFALVCALIVNRRKIDFKELHEDMEYFINRIRDVNDELKTE